MSALEDAGVTAQDQADVAEARRLVDEVNARLAARGAPLVFAVTVSSAVPRNPWPAGEIHETGIGVNRL